MKFGKTKNLKVIKLALKSLRNWMQKLVRNVVGENQKFFTA